MGVGKVRQRGPPFHPIRAPGSGLFFLVWERLLQERPSRLSCPVHSEMSTGSDEYDYRICNIRPGAGFAGRHTWSWPDRSEGEAASTSREAWMASRLADRHGWRFCEVRTTNRAELEATDPSLRNGVWRRTRPQGLRNRGSHIRGDMNTTSKNPIHATGSSGFYVGARPRSRSRGQENPAFITRRGGAAATGEISGPDAVAAAGCRGPGGPG